MQPYPYLDMESSEYANTREHEYLNRKLGFLSMDQLVVALTVSDLINDVRLHYIVAALFASKLIGILSYRF